MCRCGSPLREVRCRNAAAINPSPRDLLDAAVSAARPDGVAFGELERRLDGSVVGVADLPGRVRITESEQHGHGLRGSEREVEPGHLVRLAEPCPR